MQVNNLQIPLQNYSVTADFYQGATTDTVLLSLIGWTSERSRYKELLGTISEECGISALVFDYSGHGESPLDIAKSKPALHLNEVVTVYDWLKEQYPSARIIVVGTSYGGFMAANLINYRTVDQLILRVPAIYRTQDFYSYPDAWNQQPVTNELRVNVNALTELPLMQNAQNFKGKTLVIVHDQDEHVPPPTTDAYIEAFSADSLHFDVKHGTSEASSEWIQNYAKQIVQWITKNS